MIYVVFFFIKILSKAIIHKPSNWQNGIYDLKFQLVKNEGDFNNLLTKILSYYFACKRIHLLFLVYFSVIALFSALSVCGIYPLSPLTKYSTKHTDRNAYLHFQLIRSGLFELCVKVGALGELKLSGERKGQLKGRVTRFRAIRSAPFSSKSRYLLRSLR